MHQIPEIKRRRVSLSCPEKERRTKQSFKQECDINHIMQKFQVTGTVTHVNNHHASYADCTGVDFTNAINTATRAQQMFDELPSSLRKRFGHDPAAFLDFVQSEDPGDRAEAARLGLIPRPSDPVTILESAESGSPRVPGEEGHPSGDQQEPESPAE